MYRSIAKLAGAVALFTATFHSPAAAAEADAGASARKPNVLLILADDLGHADVGAQGISKDVRTPHIDSIAAAGVRFTNAYVTGPMCAPTRAALLTGRYQQRFGFEFNPDGPGRENKGLDVNETTLADVLRGAGYRTGIVGKWHLGYSERFQPPQRGFDEFFGFLAGAHSYFDDENTILRGSRVVEETEYLTDAFTREAVAFIDRHHDRPFFLYVPYNAPHTPMHVTDPYLERFKGVPDENRRRFLAMMAAMDDGVGRMLAALKRHGIDDDTIVIFLSDNGGPTHANTSRNDPFRGEKASTLEGAVRVPMFVRWDGHIPAGAVQDAVVAQIDLFPTICAAAGVSNPVPPERKLDGVDLLPLLGGRSNTPPHKTLYFRFEPQWAVRHGNYKLMRGRQGEPKLYDVVADPGESKDLSAEKPEVAARLRKLYDDWNAEVRPPAWPYAHIGPARPATRRGAPSN